MTFASPAFGLTCVWTGASAAGSWGGIGVGGGPSGPTGAGKGGRVSPFGAFSGNLTSTGSGTDVPPIALHLSKGEG